MMHTLLATSVGISFRYIVHLVLTIHMFGQTTLPFITLIAKFTSKQTLSRTLDLGWLISMNLFVPVQILNVMELFPANVAGELALVGVNLFMSCENYSAVKAFVTEFTRVREHFGVSTCMTYQLVFGQKSFGAKCASERTFATVCVLVLIETALMQEPFATYLQS